MLKRMNKIRRTLKLKKRKIQNQKITEEEIEKNEAIVMVELQSEDEKKDEVVGKADTTKEQDKTLY